MCRRNDEGGRRCPSDADPLKRAAKNAKKRVRYAIRKGNQPNPDDVALVNPLDLALMQQESPVLGSMPTRPEPSPSGSLFDDKGLGIKVIPADFNHGKKLFQDQLVVGRINPATLDENSYLDFGFEKFDETADWFEGENLYEHNHGEGGSLSAREKRAVSIYTGPAYDWINACAYSPDEIGLNVTAIPLTHHIPMRVDEVMDKDAHLFPEAMHLDMLESITDELDEALTKGPKKQRIVYRAVKPLETGKDVDEWVANERSIGSEVSFDGYQSTTTNKNISRFFLSPKRQGAIYEILTPEGLDVSDVSDNPEECEVLLPRKQRYIVVGNHKDANGLNVIQMVAINSYGKVLDGTNSEMLDPLIDSDQRRKAQSGGHIYAYKKTMAEAEGDLYYFTRPERGWKDKQEARQDPQFKAEVLAEAKRRTRTMLEWFDRHDDVQKLDQLFESHPDITPEEAYKLL